MNFYSSGDVVTNLPVTRYKGNITGITKLDDKAIAFTEELPLGDSRQRIIPSDSLFIGSIEDAIKFYSNETIVVGYPDTIHALAFENSQLQLLNEQLQLENNRLTSEVELITAANIQFCIDNNQLQLLNEQLQLEIENLKSENQQLQNKLLMQKTDVDESSLALSSINILNRFYDNIQPAV